MKKHIPNIITLLNAFSGFMGIVASFAGQWKLAFFCILLSVTFDLFDGLSARLLKVQSEVGKQLDSLADVISFGFLPGVILFHLMASSHNLPYYMIQNKHFIITPVLPYIAAIIPLFSALRLAKFNVDVRQTSSFIGLPTPANALLIGSFSMMVHMYCNCDPIIKVLTRWETLSAIAIASALLLIAELPLFSFKMKNLSWKDNKVPFSYLMIMGGIFIAIIASEGWSKWFLVFIYGVIYYLIHSLIARYIFKQNFEH